LYFSVKCLFFKIIHFWRFTIIFLYKVLSIVIKSKQKIFWDHTVCSRASNKNWRTKKKIHTYIPVCSSCLYIALYVFTKSFCNSVKAACMIWTSLLMFYNLHAKNWITTTAGPATFLLEAAIESCGYTSSITFFLWYVVRFIIDISLVDIIVSNGNK
jgi:hypothetical protein